MKEIIGKEYKRAAVKFKSAFDKKAYVCIVKKYDGAYAKLYESLNEEQARLLERLDTAKENAQRYAVERAFNIGFKSGVKWAATEKPKKSLDID